MHEESCYKAYGQDYYKPSQLEDKHPSAANNYELHMLLMLSAKSSHSFRQIMGDI